MPEEEENFERCNATAFVGASSSLFSFFLSLFRCRGHLIDLEIFSFFFIYFVVPLLHASFVIIRPPSSSTCLMVLVVRPFARPVGFCVKVFCTQWWRDASDDDNDDNQPTNPHTHR